MRISDWSSDVCSSDLSWAAFAMSLLLLQAVMSGGTIHYEIGGWAAPWGIEYVIDATNAIVLVIVAGIGAAVMPYARVSVAAEIPAHQHGFYYTAYLLCLAGLLGVTITGDAFNVFVFLAIMSLSRSEARRVGKEGVRTG